jgi:hypothetical protein
MTPTTYASISGGGPAITYLAGAWLGSVPPMMRPSGGDAC